MTMAVDFGLRRSEAEAHPDLRAQTDSPERLRWSASGRCVQATQQRFCGESRWQIRRRACCSMTSARASAWAELNFPIPLD